MDSSEDKTHQIKALFEGVLDLYESSANESEAFDPSILASLMMNVDFFHRHLMPPANPHDFSSLAKFKLKYETYTRGTLLCKEGDHPEKLSIILKGNVQKLHQKSYDEIENELKEKYPQKAAMLQQTKTTVSSPTKQDPRYLKMTTSAMKKQLTSRVRIGMLTMNIFKNAGSESELSDLDKKPLSLENFESLDKTPAIELTNDEPKSPGQLSIAEQALEEEEEEEEDEEEGTLDQDRAAHPSMSVFKFKRLETLANLNKHITRKSFSATSSKTLDLSDNDLNHPESHREGHAKEETQTSRIRPALKKRESVLDQQDIAFIHRLCLKYPEIKARCFLEDVVRLKKGRSYTMGDTFGDNFYKDVRPKETAMLVVTSEKLHVLTLTREVYQEIMEQIIDHARDKAYFFRVLFPSFDEEFIKKLSYSFSERHLKKGETLYHQDEPVRELFLLHSGEVRLVKTIEYTPAVNTLTVAGMMASSRRVEKIELPVASVIKQQFFGEENLLKEQKRIYTAVSAGSSVVYFLEQHMYNKVRGMFKDVFTTLKAQAKERFEWRKKRADDLYEQKKKVIDETKDSKGVKVQKKTVPRLSTRVMVKHIQGSESARIKTVGNDGNDGDKIVYKHQRPSVINITIAPPGAQTGRDFYDKKFSRKTETTFKDFLERQVFDKPSPDKQKTGLEPINVMHEFGYRKVDKFKLPNLSPSKPSKTSGSTTLRTPRNIPIPTESSYLNTDRAIYSKELSSLLNDELEVNPAPPETNGDYGLSKAIIKEVIQTGNGPANVYGFLKLLESERSPQLVPSSARIATAASTTRDTGFVNYHALAKNLVLKKSPSGVFKRWPKKMDDGRDTRLGQPLNFEVLQGVKTELTPKEPTSASFRKMKMMSTMKNFRTTQTIKMGKK